MAAGKKPSGGLKRKVGGRVYAGAKYWSKHNTDRVCLSALKKRILDIEREIDIEKKLMGKNEVYIPGRGNEVALKRARADYLDAINSRSHLHRHNAMFPLFVERKLQAKVIRWARKNRGLPPAKKKK